MAVHDDIRLKHLPSTGTCFVKTVGVPNPSDSDVWTTLDSNKVEGLYRLDTTNISNYDVTLRPGARQNRKLPTPDEASMKGHACTFQR